MKDWKCSANSTMHGNLRMNDVKQFHRDVLVLLSLLQQGKREEKINPILSVRVISSLREIVSRTNNYPLFFSIDEKKQKSRRTFNFLEIYKVFHYRIQTIPFFGYLPLHTS